MANEFLSSISEFLQPEFNSLDYCKKVTQEVFSTSGIHTNLSSLREKLEKVEEKIGLVLNENEDLFLGQREKFPSIIKDIESLELKSESLISKSEKFYKKTEQQLITLRNLANEVQNYTKLQNIIASLLIFEEHSRKILRILPSPKNLKLQLSNQPLSKSAQICQSLDELAPLDLSTISKIKNYDQQVSLIQDISKIFVGFVLDRIQTAFNEAKEIDLAENVQFLQRNHIFDSDAMHSLAQNLTKKHAFNIAELFKQNMKKEDHLSEFEKVLDEISRVKMKLEALNQTLGRDIPFITTFWGSLSASFAKAVPVVSYFKSKDGIDCYLEIRRAIFEFFSRENVKDEERIMFLKSFITYTKFYLGNFYNTACIKLENKEFEYLKTLDVKVDFLLQRARNDVLKKAVSKVVSQNANLEFARDIAINLPDELKLQPI